MVDCWKPAAAATSLYITAAGFEARRAELKALWERRNDVVKHLAAAAAEGDRSENAEYIYRKKELREIDRRLRYLQKRLPQLKVVSQLPDDVERIYFGAWVTLTDDGGAEVTYRIVGADEADAAQGLISVDTPLTRALMKRTFGDEVKITVDGHPRRYTILDIQYHEN